MDFESALASRAPGSGLTQGLRNDVAGADYQYERGRTTWFAPQAGESQRQDPIMLGDRVLKGETVAVRENYYRGVFGTVKKKSRNRDLPLPVAVLRVLKQVMDESEFKGPDDLVFATESGTPLDEKNLMRPDH